jgi:hypothetical protein
VRSRAPSARNHSILENAVTDDPFYFLKPIAELIELLMAFPILALGVGVMALVFMR